MDETDQEKSTVWPKAIVWYSQYWDNTCSDQFSTVLALPRYQSL